MQLAPLPSDSVELEEPGTAVDQPSFANPNQFRFEPAVRIQRFAAMSEEPAEPESQAPAPQRSAGQPSQGLATIAPTARDDLLELGDSFLAAGDVEWARRYYETAVAEGSAKAALALGWTYDPQYRERSNRSHVRPDATRAMAWYRVALDMGAGGQARTRLEDLVAWLRRRDHREARPPGR